MRFLLAIICLIPIIEGGKRQIKESNDSLRKRTASSSAANRVVVTGRDHRTASTSATLTDRAVVTGMELETASATLTSGAVVTGMELETASATLIEPITPSNPAPLRTDQAVTASYYAHKEFILNYLIDIWKSGDSLPQTVNHIESLIRIMHPDSTVTTGELTDHIRGYTTMFLYPVGLVSFLSANPNSEWGDCLPYLPAAGGALPGVLKAWKRYSSYGMVPIRTGFVQFSLPAMRAYWRDMLPTHFTWVRDADGNFVKVRIALSTAIQPETTDYYAHRDFILNYLLENWYVGAPLNKTINEIENMIRTTHPESTVTLTELVGHIMGYITVASYPVGLDSFLKANPDAGMEECLAKAFVVTPETIRAWKTYSLHGMIPLGTGMVQFSLPALKAYWRDLLCPPVTGTLCNVLSTASTPAGQAVASDAHKQSVLDEAEAVLVLLSFRW